MPYFTTTHLAIIGSARVRQTLYSRRDHLSRFYPRERFERPKGKPRFLPDPSVGWRPRRDWLSSAAMEDMRRELGMAVIHLVPRRRDRSSRERSKTGPFAVRPASKAKSRVLCWAQTGCNVTGSWCRRFQGCRERPQSLSFISLKSLLYLMSLAQRKPTLKSTQLGGSAFLQYTLLQTPPECQPPPRITLNLPNSGPDGFEDGLDE